MVDFKEFDEEEFSKDVEYFIASGHNKKEAEYLAQKVMLAKKDCELSKLFSRVYEENSHTIIKNDIDKLHYQALKENKVNDAWNKAPIKAANTSSLIGESLKELAKTIINTEYVTIEDPNGKYIIKLNGYQMKLYKLVD
ncbi:hypothetical protein MHB54_27805 [Paenibacillus sp. FSL M7-0802]|uniref:hypothetical protein n=1 Tax=Paenibacillus sp. FSL M7-0802 TaxID=2921536 RepID=UPI0030F8B64A